MLALGIAAATAALADTAAFDEQLRFANSAVGRIERVHHLREALRLRPDDPQNIVLEFRIGVALSQHGDPESGTDPNPSEAIPWFKGILERYNHLDYYESRAGTTSWDPQFLVPQAAVELASLLLADPQSAQERREVLLRGMEAIEQTYRKRIDDWSRALPPPTVEEWRRDETLKVMSDGPGDPEVRVRGQYQRWLDLQDAAARGDVLHDVEVGTVRAAVRQYGYTYGRQRPWEVRPAMEDLIDRFPGTPIAAVAQEHIERAAEMTRAEVDRELIEAVAVLPEPQPADLAGPDAAEGTPGPEVAAPPAPVAPPIAPVAGVSPLEERPGRWLWFAAGALAAMIAGGWLASRWRRKLR